MGTSRDRQHLAQPAMKNKTEQDRTVQNRRRERERGRERTSDKVLRSVKRIIILIKIDDFDDATLDMDPESLNAT